MKKTSPTRSARPGAVQRKNFYLRVETLKRAQKALGARTETEAVERALELVVFQEDALKAFRELCERGEIEACRLHEFRYTAARPSRCVHDGRTF
jgi:hypothetical protein